MDVIARPGQLPIFIYFLKFNLFDIIYLKSTGRSCNASTAWHSLLLTSGESPLSIRHSSEEHQHHSFYFFYLKKNKKKTPFQVINTDIKSSFAKT